MPKETLKKIDGVEIFSVGKWNGDEYSEADLDEMVRAFKENGSMFRPPLKLGHDVNQTLLQRDGHPAAGWINNLYRKGKKLLADFVDIPSKVYELIEKGAYKKVSAEVYWNAQVGESKYKRLLGAVALLGADLPAVTNLSDIFQMYSKDAGELRCYDLREKSLIIEQNPESKEEIQGMEKTEEQLKLESDLQTEKARLHTLEQEVATKDQELATLKQFKAEAEAKFAADEQKLKEAELEKNLTDLQAEKLITPAMRPYVKELLCVDKKEYAFKAEGKEDQVFTKPGLLKEILRLHSAASKVNVDESSEDNKVVEPKDDKALDQKIQTYAKERGVSYKDAYKAVVREHSAKISM